MIGFSMVVSFTIGCFHLPLQLGMGVALVLKKSDPSQERLNGKGHGRSAEEVSSGESASALRKRGLEQQLSWAPFCVNGVLSGCGRDIHGGMIYYLYIYNINHIHDSIVLYRVYILLKRVYSDILTIQGWSEGAVVQILYAFVELREGDGVGASEAGSS